MLFGEVADDYARWRPSYPPEAVSWLAPPVPARVVDVGAGTGQLTGALLDLGLSVDAVEAEPRMLDVLTSCHPGAVAHRAVSDALPILDASVDAVLVADAWHWFPFDETVAEVRRVLAPDGWLGLVWNLVTPVEPWELELAGIDPDRKGLGGPAFPALPFPADETVVARFPWTWEVTAEQFCGALATNFAVIAMDPAAREARLAAARAVIERVCASSGRHTVGVHHEAACVRWVPEAFATCVN